MKERQIIFYVILSLLTVIAQSYEPLYEEIECEKYSSGCRQCVRYVKDFEEVRRGCEDRKSVV